MAQGVTKAASRSKRTAALTPVAKKKGKAKAAPAEAPPLVVALDSPGMTPMLRCGAGGLAASVRSIARKRGNNTWPAAVRLGAAEVRVEPRRIVFDWNGADPAKALKELFRESFLVGAEGLIHCVGWDEGGAKLGLATRVRLQSALKRTFLQHGKSTQKKGKPLQRTETVDDQDVVVEYQPYASFAHQAAWEEVARAARGCHVALAGWAYPGATERHVTFKDTRCEYSASQALAGCFAIAGSVCFEVPRGGGGVLVLLVPDDLVRFAESRPRVTPRSLAKAVVGGAGDAVLTVQLELRADQEFKGRAGVEAIHGVLLRTTPWARQQKSRVAVLQLGRMPEETLDLFESVSLLLPARVRTQSVEDDDDNDEASGFFMATSALRAFICDNLAVGRAWFDGFATAKTTEKNPRFIHYYREGKNLGALFSEERKGLIVMTEQHLDETEKALVRSVHLALRQRFGAIANESAANTATMKNRFSAERDRWRYAFSGSKTGEQIRGALSSLWSRAGPNAELQKNWEQILPLLREEKWQLARDLALVALASYQGVRSEEDVESNDAEGASNE